jgi:hypothetical protein
MKPESSDKLLRSGAKAVVAALAKRGIEGRDVARLAVADPFAGEVCLVLEACRAGNVLVLERPVARLPDRLRQRLAGIVMRRELPGAPLSAGDVILRDRDSLVAIPGNIADQIAEEAAEAVAFEEFTAEQVNQGGGVYGLHIPSGERAKAAFAAWRRIKGR